VNIEPGTTAHYLVAASGAIPAFILMFYFDWLDRKRPEPWGLRYLVTLVGVLSVVPTLIIDQLLMNATGAGFETSSYGGAGFNAFVLAGGVEEMCKISAVFLVVWFSKSFDERMDGLVYGARAGLGFALLENCLYVYKSVEADQLVQTWVARAVLAVPGHAMWSGMLGYFAARRRFDKAGPGILGGYLIAVAFHGLYDFAVFVHPALSADIGESANFILLTPLALTAVGWVAVRHCARTALYLDDHSEARRAGVPMQGQMPYPPQQYPGYPPHQYPGYPPQQYPGYPPGQVPYYWYWPGPPRR
jgi:RsiW-degrading membrane proteinase PrsW (M82 family)